MLATVLLCGFPKKDDSKGFITNVVDSFIQCTTRTINIPTLDICSEYTPVCPEFRSVTSSLVNQTRNMCITLIQVETKVKDSALAPNLDGST